MFSKKTLKYSNELHRDLLEIVRIKFKTNNKTIFLHLSSQITERPYAISSNTACCHADNCTKMR